MERIQLIKNQQPVVKNEYWQIAFNNLLEVIRNSSDSKKINYSPERLDLDHHLTFDLLVQNKEIVGFCGIYSGDRYSQGVFRVLNRCFVAPNYRKKNLGAFSNLNSQFLLKPQLEEFKEQIAFPFVSREGSQGYHFLKMWSKNHAPGDNWIVGDFMAHVAPASESAPAYQFICYPKDRAQMIETLTTIPVVEWKKRFES